MKFVASLALLLLAFSSQLHAENRVALTDADLVQLANRKYASGELPLGDNRYNLNEARKGSIDLCRKMGDPNGGGAGRDGPWIHGSTWNIQQKLSVSGNVRWDQATFSNNVTNDKRVLSGNGLPINHTTGVFPIQSTDTVYAYDRNPSRISEQSVLEKLPAHPVYSDTPHCMGMEVGYMLSGVALFNGFDAGLRDAAAHEAQDGCQGHPQQGGNYHYHSLSSCLGDASIKKVIGYALDGFPITGPMVTADTYLTTDELDVCHGVTSEIVEDGVTKTSYHYVMTLDFPYSVSCFRGTPVRTGPASGQGSMMNMPGQVGQGQQQNMQQGMQPGTQRPDGPPPQDGPQGNPMRGPPPQEAFEACDGRGEGKECFFTSPRGDAISGTCRLPRGDRLVCVPRR